MTKYFLPMLVIATLSGAVDAAQCTATAATDASDHSTWLVDDARNLQKHPFIFEIDITHSVSLRNASGGLVSGIQDNEFPPNSPIYRITVACMPPGSYSVVTGKTCDDGSTASSTTPLQVGSVKPGAQITGLTHLPSGEYRIDTTFSVPPGHFPIAPRWLWYRRLAGGGYVSQPLLFFNNVIPAQPGDKVEVDFGSCGIRDSVPAASVIVPAPVAVEVAVEDGDGQKAVIGEIAENPLKVKFTATDPSFDLSSIAANFEIVSVPAGATGQAIGANGSATSTTYSAPVGGNGIATAVIIVGNVPGSYVVRVKSPLSATGAEATFTTTAVKPVSVALLKDTTNLADRADTYAASGTERTLFHAVGLDAAGVKIGPIRCNWSTSAKGNPATRGAGSLSPAAAAVATTLQPTKVGKLELTATPSMKGVSPGVAQVFLTSLYVSVQNTFNATSPVDDSARFVPGMYLDGTNVALDVMKGTGQFISLHVLTGGAKGKATFSVDSTNYPGIAMNYPLDGDSTEDMMFTNGQQSITVDFATKTGDTWTTLLIRDFGASGTIGVSIESGKNTYTLPALRLPVDADGNGLPDAGWWVGSNQISSTALTATIDADGDGGGDEPAKTGDGLSAFEEMRGLIVASSFTRLDPRKRDFFIVADADLLAFSVPGNSATPLTYLTPLPLWIHYLELEDVAGEDYPARQLMKIKPLVNPNRAGVPGARPNGQRALRVIHQTLFWPSVTIFIPGPPPVEQDIAIWQHGVFGATVLDHNDYERIDRDQNGNLLTAFVAETPNGTSFVEWYAKTFENVGIHTDFTDGLAFGYHDEDGNEVPACLSPNDANCDIWADQLIVPRELPGGYLDELHTVPEYAGDYYTGRAFTCQDMVRPVPGGMSLQDFTRLKAAVVAHEVGHGLDIDHDTSCDSLMFDGTFLGTHRTMADIIPIPSAFGESHRDAIRLKD